MNDKERAGHSSTWTIDENINEVKIVSPIFIISYQKLISNIVPLSLLGTAHQSLYALVQDIYGSVSLWPKNGKYLINNKAYI